MCERCNMKHPTMLHIHPQLRAADVAQTEAEPESVKLNALISVQSSSLTGASEFDRINSILPVRVKFQERG